MWYVIRRAGACVGFSDHHALVDVGNEGMELLILYEEGGRRRLRPKIRNPPHILNRNQAPLMSLENDIALIVVRSSRNLYVDKEHA